MGVMDVEAQRERRTQLLSEAESQRAGRRRRANNGSGAISKLASFLLIGR